VQICGRSGRPFATPPIQCDNTNMPKSFALTLSTLATATLLLASSLAQQTPATAAPASAAPASSAKAKQAPPAKSSSSPSLTTQKEKFSYAVGMNLGMNFQRQAVPIDPDLLARGLKDSLAGKKPLLTEDEAKAVLMEVQNEFHKRQQELAQQQAEANKKEGPAFLAANKTKDGVVTLPSGLQYKILHAGTGPKPAATDTVNVNYRGTLINGTEFDSSYKRGQPATFPVNGVIKGWTEALQLMPVGSKWQLFVPSDLAYGDHAASALITPNSTLIFEVELLSIKPPEKIADKPADKKPEDKK
jgi:FKBP-type peptidyl-prolyl cis-trans isomerase FklB